MKTISIFLMSGLLLLCAVAVWAFSSHNTTISRTFDTLETDAGNTIIVTINFTNNEAGEIRGFFYTEQIPSGLSVQTKNVAINGKPISNYVAEAGTEGDVYANYIPYRWIIETPPLFEENNPIHGSDNLEIIYTVSSTGADSYRLDQFNWAGYYQDSQNENQAAFGHSENNDKQTITFAKADLVAVNDQYALKEGETLTLPAPGVLANDTGADGNSLTAVTETNVSHGTLTLNTDGSFSYSHDGSETTQDSFTYHATDGSSDSNAATVTINVSSVNDAPVANDDTTVTKENTSVIIDLCCNDTDTDGVIDHSSVIINDKPSYGTTEINKDGTVTYTPDNGFTGNDSFSYTFSDNRGSVSNKAMVSVSVNKDSDGQKSGGGGGCFILIIR